MSRIQLHFLGSGDAFGSGGRFQPCLCLKSENDSILIDCGASSLSAMKREAVNPAEVGWVLISHLHGDHFAGVPFLILDGQFSKRTRPLVVAGPPGIRKRIETAMEAFFSGSSGVTRCFPIDYLELTERVPMPIGACTVTSFEVLHPSGAPSYAFRVELAGKILAYSGDTEWSDVLAEVAAGADLFVCEAYFYEKKVRYHLSYKDLLARREQLGCRRLVMTHMNQDLLSRLTEVKIEYATDGLTIVL